MISSHFHFGSRIVSIFSVLICLIPSPSAFAQSDRGGTPPPPTFKESHKTLAPIKATEGRIFFFREPFSGGLFTPTVIMNEKPLSLMSSGEVFFVDRPLGKYQVTVDREVERSASFTLGPGETKYIKISPSPGFFVANFLVELMSEKEALYEMGPLEMSKPKSPE